VESEDRLVEIILDKHNYSAPSLAKAILKEYIHIDELPKEKYKFQDKRSLGYQADFNEGYNQCLTDIKKLREER